MFQDDLQLLAGIEDNSDSDIEDHDNDLDAEPVRKDEVSFHTTVSQLWCCKKSFLLTIAKTQVYIDWLFADLLS